jgi:hypothetical protein
MAVLGECPLHADKCLVRTLLGGGCPGAALPEASQKVSDDVIGGSPESNRSCDCDHWVAHPPKGRFLILLVPLIVLGVAFGLSVASNGVAAAVEGVGSASYYARCEKSAS